MLEKLFESLDEKVFTPEVKEQIKDVFNEAVEIKALEIADEKITEKLDELNEKQKEFEEKVAKKYEQELQEKYQSLVEKLDDYLELVIEKFVNENKEKLNALVKNKKVNAVLEAFDSMLVTTGVEVSRIVEEVKETSPVNIVKSLKEKNNELVEELIKTRKENEKLLRLGIINEMCEGLSLVEAERFKKLANLVEFSYDDSYVKKLEMIKENVKAGSSKVNESQTLNESGKKDSGNKPSWYHLI